MHADFPGTDTAPGGRNWPLGALRFIVPAQEASQGIFARNNGNYTAW